MTVLKRGILWLTGSAAVAALLVGAWALSEHWAADRQQAGAAPLQHPLELVGEQTLRLSLRDWQRLGLQVAEVEAAAAPEPLRLSGSLTLDPNALARVHTLFSGQVVQIGNVSESAGATEDAAARRPLRYGDSVRKEQVLAVIWSKDIGEKKSELIDAISKLETDTALLRRYEEVDKGVISQRNVDDARRNVEADTIAVAKAERTLRSWRLTEAELDEVRREAERVRKRAGTEDDGLARHWAETAVRAPFDGVVVEKNIAIGDIVDPTLDLFKVADLSRLQVLASVYEENLPTLLRLAPEQRRWTIQLSSFPHAAPLKDQRFEVIGKVIDPVQHTGTVMGLVSNPWDGDEAERAFQVGQFITAIIDLAPDATLVAVPATALVEQGKAAVVFVQSDPARTELTARQVAVVRRGQERVFVRRDPSPAEQRNGAQSLRPGDRVVVVNALELADELENLKSAGPLRPASYAPAEK